MIGAALSWVHLAGADACVGTQALARAVEERAGRAVFVPMRDADVVVEGSIERRDDVWRAVLVARDRQEHEIGRRALVVTDARATCDGMTAPVVEAIVDLLPAMAIVVAVAEKQREETKERERQRRASPPVHADGERAALTLETGAGVMGSMGLLPELTALGAGIDALLEPRGVLSLRGFASFWLDRTARPGDDLSMALAGAGPCLDVARGRAATLRACVEGELGVLRARGNQPLAPVTPAAALLLNVDAGLRLTVPIAGPFVARGGAAFVLPLLRPRFVALDDEVFRVAPVAALADVGLGVRLP